MKIGWGWKIVLLYGGFVAMIVCLVAASNRQKIDLVSKDYYKDEIAYQSVLDASKNQSGVAGQFFIHANSDAVTIEFPGEFEKDAPEGEILFYSASNQDWDRSFSIHTDGNKMSMPRSAFRKTVYEVKISYVVSGKNYYYQAQLNLNS